MFFSFFIIIFFLNECKLTHQVGFSSGARCSNIKNPHGHLCRQSSFFLSAWGLQRGACPCCPQLCCGKDLAAPWAFEGCVQWGGTGILEGGSHIHNWGQRDQIEQKQNEVGYLDKLLKCVLDHLWERVPEVPTDALLVQSFKSFCLGHHMLPVAAALGKQSRRLRKLGQEGLGEVILASRDEGFYLKHPQKTFFKQ